jgi:hypothetical protein
MLAALVLYYIPYAVSYDHAIFLGLLLGAIMKDREARKHQLVLPKQTNSARVFPENSLVQTRSHAGNQRSV